MPFHLLAALALATALAAAPAPIVIVPRPVHGLATSEAGVVVVTSDGVRVFDPLGRPIRVLWPTGGRHPRAHPKPPAEDLGALPDLTADSDWAEHYDSDDLDDSDDPRLANQTEPSAWDVGESERRTNPSLLADDAPIPGALAAGGGSAWIGRTDGLWRINLVDGASRRVLGSLRDGIHRVASTPDGRIIAAVIGGALFRSTDEGQTFESLAFVGSPRALAVALTGSVFVIADGGLSVFRPVGTKQETLDVFRPKDVVSCGPETVILGHAGLFTIADSSVAPLPTRLADVPTGAEHIACHADASLLVAFGASIWVGVDRGRSWVLRNDLPPAPIREVGITSQAIWIATSLGLLRLPMRTLTGSVDTGTSCERPAPPTLSRNPTGPRPVARFWRWWYAGLPRVDLSFTAAKTVSRRDLRGLVVLTFILDRGAPWQNVNAGSEIVPLKRATEISGRVSATDWGPPDADPIAAEEHDALIRSLEDNP